MRCLDRLRETDKQAKRVADPHGPFLQPSGKGHPRDVFEDEEGGAGGLFEIVDRCDSVMAHRGEQLRLAPESLQAFRIVGEGVA